MKFILILMIFLMGNSWAQTTPVKVVFDISSKDVETHQSAMRHVSMMAAAYPDSDFEVVVYGKALPMVLLESSLVTKEIQQFQDNERVTFMVCEETMKRQKVDKSQLIKNVQTVPDGILEIVMKQKEGWGYIKETNN